jgi:hypothetical protein
LLKAGTTSILTPLILPCSIIPRFVAVAPPIHYTIFSFRPTIVTFTLIQATVSVYSSSLPPDFLDDWKKLGYNVKVERLNMRERAKGTPLEDWASKLAEWRDGPYYYAHLSDAARLLVLHKEGGVYFDTDVVFVKPMDGVRNGEEYVYI